MECNNEQLRNDITQACQRVSARLRRKLMLPITISIPTTREMEFVDKNWPDKKLNWTSSVFFNHPSLCRFKVVVKAQDKILGVLENCYEKEDQYHGLVIQQIQRSADPNHPLKGKLIAIFSETNLEIAKSLGIKKMTVDRPVKETVPSYEKLGYRVLTSSKGFAYQTELDVTPDTRLNFKSFGMA